MNEVGDHVDEAEHSRLIKEFHAWANSEGDRGYAEWCAAHPLGCTCETCEGHRDRIGRGKWVCSDGGVQHAGAYLARYAEIDRLTEEFRARGGYTHPSLLLDEAQRVWRDERLREHAVQLAERLELESGPPVGTAPDLLPGL